MNNVRALLLGLALAGSFPATAAPLATDDGFRGIWYFNQPTKDEYRYATNRTGDHVWRLPAQMSGDLARPEIAW
jgi:hypothetical protein